MEVDWKHSQCIICLTSCELTLEHLIPESLGGILTCKFLCSGCNSKFGHGFEAKAKLAPAIRKAANQLTGIIPALVQSFENGAEYVSQFGDYSGTRRLRNDGNLGTMRLEDGSLIVPEPEARRHIISVMQSTGADANECAQAIAIWEATPATTEVHLGNGVSIKKWRDQSASPTYAEPELNPLVPLKIAYEFAALLVGGAIYSPHFQPLRDILLEQNSVLAQEMVSYNWAAKPEPFHGIAFQGNTGVAQFQVRLFGLLAYTVRLPKIAIEHPRIAYTQFLATNSDSVSVLDNIDEPQ